MAFALLVFIAGATLSPPSLRPGTGNALLERWLAFASLGMLLGVGYPKSIWRCMLFAAVVVVGLELLQELVPGRHARLVDAVVKLSGAIAGLGLVVTVGLIAQGIGDRQSPT